MFFFLPGLFLSCDTFFEIDDREMLTEDKIVNNDNDVAGLWAYLIKLLEWFPTSPGGTVANAQMKQI